MKRYRLREKVCTRLLASICARNFILGLRNFILGTIYFLVVPSLSLAQSNPTPLLPESLIDQLIHEVSGAMVMSHAIKLGGYNHERLKAEYENRYHESIYIEEKARLYKLSNAHVETFPLDDWTWGAERAELWLEKPERRLIVRYRDIPACLAPGSWNGDISSTDLVYARAGTHVSDYDSLDVKGKLVLVSGSLSQAHKVAVRNLGAAGILSFYNPAGRPVDNPDQIAWQGLRGRSTDSDTAQYPYEATFGFSLSHRMGMDLLSLLEQDQSVKLSALVHATTYPADMEVPTAAIPGNGASDQEIVVSAHLFEGIAKQGPNDNMSGSAAILEAARTLNTLILAGKLPRPKRTIRFLWGPEFSGIYAYLERYPEERGRMIAAINIDMIGSRQTRNGNSLHLYRNPWSQASFVDDVTEHFFEYLGDTNREKVHNRRIKYGFMKPVIDPTGSRDPFYYHIESYFGSSDHAVFNGRVFQIPAVLFNNWPDIAYHTSEDRAANLDPTQLKRGAFLIAASAYYLANISAFATPALATRMAAMGVLRIDEDIRRQLNIMTMASTADIGLRYKEARLFISEYYQREQRNLNSLQALVDPRSSETRQLNDITKELMKRSSYDQDRVKSHFRRLTRQVSIPAREPKETDQERIADALIPDWVEIIPDSSLSVVRRMLKALRYNQDAATLIGLIAAECRNFCDGQRTILDIQKTVSAEFGSVPVADVMRYFYELEHQGHVRIRSKK